MNQKCSQYLLKKIIIRIDYEQAQEIDVDNAVQKVRKHFFEKRYKLFQNVVPLTSVQTEGAVPIGELNGISAVNVINESFREYQFRKLRETIKFSSRCLIIEDLIENDYKGSKSYIDNIVTLMSALYEENSYIFLKRIGLRKIDSLVFKEISNIGKYFDDKVFNQSDSLEKYRDFGDIFVASNSKISIASKEKICKANIITDIQTGDFCEESGETGQAIQAVLDIDMYKDQFEKNESDEFVNYIVSIYNVLNKESYNIYKSALTERFYSDLLKGTVNDTDILGGVFNVQNCD